MIIIQRIDDFPLESFPANIVRHSLYRDDGGKERLEGALEKPYFEESLLTFPTSS